MSVNQKNENTSHKLWLNNREVGSVSGVNDVISFDLNEIVLETVMGILTVKGNNFHVKSINLDKGEVDFEGETKEMVYSDTKAMKKQSLMGRLFR